MTMFGATDYALHPASAEVLCINCVSVNIVIGGHAKGVQAAG